MSNADSEIIKVAFILDYIHLPPFDIHQQLLRARKTCDCCTAGDLMTIRQYERPHFKVGSGYYFASAVPMMVVVLVGWYLIKHVLARRRHTPNQRGIYEHLFFELATTHPRLWSRSGPNDYFRPRNTLDRMKWRLIKAWNDSTKT